MTESEKQALIAAGIEQSEVSDHSDAEMKALESAGLSASGEDKATAANYMKAPPKTTEGEAALVGAQQGLTLGFADELGGAIGAGTEKLADLVGNSEQDAINSSAANLTNPKAREEFLKENKPEKKSVVDLYKEYRDAMRQQAQNAGAEHPIMYTGGNIAGGFLMPGAALGQAGKGASLAQKIGRGMAVGGGVGAVAGAGNSEHSPIAQPKEFGQDVLSGGEMGIVVGGAVPVIGTGATKMARGENAMERIAAGTALGAGAGGTYGAVKSKHSPMEEPLAFAGDVAKGAGVGALGGAAIPAAVEGVGILGSPVIKGIRQGWRGNNLLGDAAEKAVQAKIQKFGEDHSAKLIEDLNGFGKLKSDLMDLAKQAGIKLDQDDIDKMILGRINENDFNATRTALKSAKREMEDLKEMLRYHREGPQVEQVKRVFYGDKPTQLKKFEDLLKQKQILQKAKANPDLPPAVESEITSMPTEREEFEKLFHVKQAEQKAVPGGADPNPLELSYEPIEGSNQVLGVIKQPQYDADGSFIGYKKVATRAMNPNQPIRSNPAFETQPSGNQPLEMIFEPLDEGKVQGIIREPIVDGAGNILSYKIHASKPLELAEAAKFKDITETMRAGGKDLTDIGNFKDLLNDLNEVGQYGGTPYQSRQASTAVGKLYTEGRDMLRDRVDSHLTETYGAEMPTMKGTDQNINSIHNGIETLRLGDETVKQSIGDKQKAYEAIVNLVNQQELVGAAGGNARTRVAKYIEQIRKVDPAYADKIEREFADLGEQAIVSKTTAGITDANKLTGVKRHFVAAGNAVGLVANKIANLPPERVKQLGQKFLMDPASKGKRELGKILSQLPDKTERERNAMLFGIMQNPAYRKWLQEEDEQTTPAP